MGPEIEDKEMKKYAVQQELINLLDETASRGNLPRFVLDATTALDIDKGNHLYNIVDLLAPKLRDSQILDLFCGSNSVKLYFKEHNFSGQVTGVDLDSKMADIQADVAQLAQVLSPQGQFDTVISCGSVPGVEDFQVTANYLKDNGLYITGGSNEIADECVLPMIENPKALPKDEYQAETRKIMKLFLPVAMVDVQHIPNNFGVDLNDCYVLWRKIKKSD